MHFALPRKSSQPPPYTRLNARSAASHRRNIAFQILGTAVLGSLFLYLILSWLNSAASFTIHHGEVPEDSTLMIVTVLDETSMSEDYIQMIKTNRDDYAARHGYKTWYTTRANYTNATSPSPSSWALIPALRQALNQHPEIDYIWSLTPNALITNVSLDIHSHMFSRLSSLMRKDIPVVPPDSVIHTFSHLKPTQAHLIITQDMENLAHDSFFLRNSNTIPVGPGQSKEGWSEYFLDAWFDPLYRAYAFQKAENHALEHLVQWHPTILAKLVIVDQRLINAYPFQAPILVDPVTQAERIIDSKWQPGDWVINLKGCDGDDVASRDPRDCEAEMRDHFAKWQDSVQQIDGQRPVVKLSKETYVRTTKPKITNKQVDHESHKLGRVPMQKYEEKIEEAD